MNEVIQCLIDWLDSIPNDERPHQILHSLAKESLIKAHLDEKLRRFTNKDIVAAVGVTINEPANKWVDWNQSVLPYWNSKKDRIIDFARKQGLKSYPNIGYFIPEKGGRGIESRYWLIAEPLPEINDEEQQPKDEVSSPAKQTNIRYQIAENGEVAPSWIFYWLLHDGQIRLSKRLLVAYFSLLLILFLFVVALSLISWTTLSVPQPVTARDLTTLISIFAVPYTVWLIFIKPCVRIFDDRIVPAPELLVSFDEKSAQLELFKDGDLRLIRLVRYTAPCPICGATLHLEDGSPDYPRRLVGRCYDSPREHVFSFDRVTRRGTVLRSPFISAENCPCRPSSSTAIT
jgi:hypothetical protein